MPPTTGAVQIFLDSDYQGATASLEEGSYDIEHLKAGEVGNDAISSLQVADGYQVTVYTDAGHQGASKVFTADVPRLGDDFNDTISSLKVTKKDADTPATRSSMPTVTFRSSDGRQVPQDVIALVPTRW